MYYYVIKSNRFEVVVNLKTGNQHGHPLSLLTEEREASEDGQLKEL